MCDSRRILQAKRLNPMILSTAYTQKNNGLYQQKFIKERPGESVSDLKQSFECHCHLVASHFNLSGRKGLGNARRLIHLRITLNTNYHIKVTLDFTSLFVPKLLSMLKIMQWNHSRCLVCVEQKNELGIKRPHAHNSLAHICTFFFPSENSLFLHEYT